MRNYFVIMAKLPSLNEYIDKCRTNRQVGARCKRETEDIISWFIKLAVNRGTLRQPQAAVIVHFKWHERTQKRDADNIVSAKKYILDALQKCGILINDGRKYVKGFTDIVLDDKEDFVEVELKEVEQ